MSEQLRAVVIAPEMIEDTQSLPLVTELWLPVGPSQVVALDARCRSCQGAGVQLTPEWQTWLQAVQAAPRSESLLAASGLLDAVPDPDRQSAPCATCGGMGLELTCAGEALVEFCRRWLGGQRVSQEGGAGHE